MPAAPGLRCVVISSPDAQRAFEHFQTALGSDFILVPSEERWPTLNRIIDETGFMPASNLTRFHTGNPFGPEGYKTIAYEIFNQLGGSSSRHGRIADRLRRVAVRRGQRLSRAQRPGR